MSIFFVKCWVFTGRRNIKKMEERNFKYIILGIVVLLSISIVNADDPYKFFTWTVTYGNIAPLGVPQQVCIFGY